MKVTLFIFLMIFSTTTTFAQIDNQKRFQSDQRKFYTYNYDFQKYELKETEYEHSIIDIREVGSKTNGYIAISLHDNGLTKLYHGSIYSYTQDSKDEGTWLFKSKDNKAKMTYNPKDNTITFLFDGNKERYTKLYVFNVVPDELPDYKLKKIFETSK